MSVVNGFQIVFLTGSLTTPCQSFSGCRRVVNGFQIVFLTGSLTTRRAKHRDSGRL